MLCTEFAPACDRAGLGPPGDRGPRCTPTSEIARAVGAVSRTIPPARRIIDASVCASTALKEEGFPGFFKKPTFTDRLIVQLLSRQWLTETADFPRKSPF